MITHERQQVRQLEFQSMSAGLQEPALFEIYCYMSCRSEKAPVMLLMPVQHLWIHSSPGGKVTPSIIRVILWANEMF